MTPPSYSILHPGTAAWNSANSPTGRGRASSAAGRRSAITHRTGSKGRCTVGVLLPPASDDGGRANVMRPKFLPDWRRNHSKGFLTLWLVVFTGLPGAEWGLRRLWGMV